MAPHSGANHLLDGVARQRVDEERNKDDEQDEDEALDHQPLVVVPQNVANRLQRIEHPNEGGVGSAS